MHQNGTHYKTPAFFVYSSGQYKLIELDRSRFDSFDSATTRLANQIVRFTREPFTDLSCEKLQKLKQKDAIFAFVYFGTEKSLKS